MPAVAQIPVEEIINALCDVEIFQDNFTSIKPRSDKIWEEVSKLLNGRVNPATLNLYARINRNNILTDVKKRRGIAEVPIPIANSTLNSTSDIEQYSEYVIDELPKNGPLPVLFITLDIENDVWQKIAPETKQYTENKRLRSYEALQGTWTDILAKRCYELTKIPCAFIFKRAKICNSADSIWLKISGKCKECDSKFQGHCLSRPKPGNGISIAVTLTDTRGVQHGAKRPLKGTNRIIVGDELLMKKAAAWRKCASKNMKFGDPEPSYIPNHAVLRKARQEAHNRDLGIKKSLNVFDSLLDMKYNGEYAGYITDIGLDEFYCIYCLPIQIIIYKDRIRKVKRVSIDATGGVALPIRKLNEETKYVFLYQMVMDGEDEMFPVYQMLSAKHSTIAINYWLNMFRSRTERTPEEVVCDFSLALLNGISLSFNERTLKTYISDCHIWLTGETLQHPLHCYTRLDIAHLIKMMCRKKVFAGKPGRVKDFYIRCIGVMTMSETTIDFERLLLSTLVVALSECDGQDELGQDIMSQQRENFLFNRIKTFIYTEDDALIEDNEENYLEDEPFDVDSNVIDFIKNIKIRAEEEANKCLEFERPNPYHLPGIVEPLMNLAQFFTLWTNVMKRKCLSQYDVGTSAISEAYFKCLKSSEMCNYSGSIRADKFIVTHIRSIEATCKFERAATKRKNARPLQNKKAKKLKATSNEDVNDSSEEEKCSEIDSDLVKNNNNKEHKELIKNDHLFQEEDWKGRNMAMKVVMEERNMSSPIQSNIKSKIFANEQNKENEYLAKNKKQRGKYLTACTDIELIHNRPLRRKKNVILRNGICLGPVFIGKRLIQLKNTCPFDSIIEILATAYVDNACYKEKVDLLKESSLTTNLMRNYATNGATADIYKERAVILASIFNEEKNILNCAANNTWLIEKLLADMPSASQVTNCINCKPKSSTRTSVEIGHMNMQNGGTNRWLLDSIEKYFSQIQGICKGCKHDNTIQKNSGIHLILDIEFALDPRIHRILNSNSLQKLVLSEIPTTITVDKKTYILNEVIEFLPPRTPDGIGHYTAYCRRIVNSWEIHDDMCKELRKLTQYEKREINATTIVYTQIA